MEKKSSLKLQKLKIENISQRKIMIIGGTGSGKTTTLKLLAIESPIPIYVFDPLDVISIPKFSHIVIRKKYKNFGGLLAKILNRFPAKFGTVISFREMLQTEIQYFMQDLFREWKPKNCIIAFDEIHEFTPKNYLNSEIERKIKHGRNSNVGFIGTTQRPAYVAKNVLALSDYILFYRITYATDLQAVRETFAPLMSRSEQKNTLGKLQRLQFLEGIAIDFRPRG